MMQQHTQLSAIAGRPARDAMARRAATSSAATASTAQQHLAEQPINYINPREGQGAGITRDVWLLLYREGGIWTMAEIRDALPELTGPLQVPGALLNMTDRGFVLKHGSKATGVKYRVNRACRIPQGISLGDLLDAQNMVQEPAEC